MSAPRSELHAATPLGPRSGDHSPAAGPIRLRRGRLRLRAAALRLHLLAQRLRRERPLEGVRRLLLERGSLARTPEPQEALEAAAWAARWARRIGGQLDTCLLRALVAATLLADRPGITVRVGVRLGDSGASLLHGHAWLCIQGRPLRAPGEERVEDFEEILELPMERSP